MLLYFTDGDDDRWLKKAMEIYLTDNMGGEQGTGLKLAGSQIKREAPGRLRLLLSYHYFKKIDLDKMLGEFNHPQGEVFADSGAFSAKSLGAEVVIGDYANWLKRWRHWFGPMANLDVIGDPAGTVRNQTELERLGLPVLPVFHVGSGFEHLDQLAGRYEYMALGGMVGRPASILGRWIAKCHQIVGDRTRFHGFGMTSWKLMQRFPWRSVDSSSWGAGHRYGQLQIFNPIKGAWIKFQVGTKDPIAHARLFRQLGCEPMDFVDRRRYHATKAIELSIRSWAKAAEYLARRSQVALHLSVPTEGIQASRKDTTIAELRVHLSGNTEYSLPSRRQASVDTFRGLYLAGDTEFHAEQRRPACVKAFWETIDDS